MARRPTALPRAHEHLVRAAAVHARITAGEAHPSESEASAEAVTEPTIAQRRARSQRRNEEGQFA